MAWKSPHSRGSWRVVKRFLRAETVQGKGFPVPRTHGYRKGTEHGSQLQFAPMKCSKSLGHCDFRKGSRLGNQVLSDTRRYCGKPRPDASPPASRIPSGETGEHIRLETLEKNILAYYIDSEILTVTKPGKWGNCDEVIAKESLAGKNVRPEMISRGTPGKALKASAGGLIAGATVLPAVGTIYGVARAATSARAVAVSLVGNGINFVFETHDRTGAMHFANTINNASASLISGNSNPVLI